MSKMFQCYGIGQALIPVLPPPLKFENAPTSNQTNYEVGQVVYTGTPGAYTFYIYSGAGIWEVLESGSGNLSTLTTDDSTVVVPTAGNINLKGAGSTTTIGSGSNATVQLTGLTNHSVLVGAGTTTITKVGPSAIAGQIFQSGGAAADPLFSTATYPSTVVAGDLLYASATNVISGLADVAVNQVLVSGGVGVAPAYSATPTVTTLTATTVHGTTIDTNVVAAQLSLNGTTIDASGSDANVSLNITTKNTGSIIFSQSKAGVDQNMQITNSDNTAAPGNAGLQLAVGGSTSTGDPYVSFQISGVAASTMTMGLDNSASDIFVISNSASIGTSNALTLTQAGALTATTSITATAGDITATNGNIVRGTAGNKDVYSSVASNGTAGANSAGTATLTGGTITINTTSVTASSIIRLYRQGIGATGAAALGILTVGTIFASTSFVINSVQAADATALQASDVSIVAWEIVN